MPLQDGYCVYHTRDEVPERNSPDFPWIIESTDFKLYRPLDSRSKGSWIVTSDDGVTGCLLNGAFGKHERHLPYKHSRGKVLLDLMQEKNKLEHLRTVDLDNIEPFTLVLFKGDIIMEMRWDEKQKHFKSIDPHKPEIWSSATLYSEEKAKMREEWFAKWLAEKGQSPATLEDFHHHGGIGDPEVDIIMKRKKGPCSVSITSLVKNSQKAEFCFEDLIRGEKKCVEIIYGKGQ